MKTKYNIILLIILFLFVSCVGQKMRIGRTTDFLGPNNDSYMYWIDTDINKIYSPIEINIHTFIFEKNNDIKVRFGLGGRIGTENEFNNFTFLSHGGLSLVPDGGEIPGLADSPIYGTLRIGVRYNPWKFGIFIDHISSPLHGAKDGDDGKTLFLFEKEF